MWRVKSMMTASPTACPARALPPPRGKTGTPKFAGDFVDSDYIISMAGKGHRQRHDLIIAGISAVEHARHLVGGSVIMTDGGAEVMQQFVDLHGLVLP